MVAFGVSSQPFFLVIGSVIRESKGETDHCICVLLTYISAKKKVRLWYPPNDKPLFVYPAISILKYDWSRKSTADKVIEQGLIVLALLAFGYLAVCFSNNHFITWHDLSWSVIFKIFGCLLTLALFPLLVAPVVLALRSERPPYQPQSTFYSDWARIYTGFGKGQHILFFAEDVESFEIEKAWFEDATFYLVTISFKQGFMEMRRAERCGFRVGERSELQRLFDWAQTNRVKIIEKAAEKIQRRS